MTIDTGAVLRPARWQVRSCPPGAYRHPADVTDSGWFPAAVPGTVAGAARDAGVAAGDPDASDWWYRTEVEVGTEVSAWRLTFDGLATLAEVWVNGEPVLQTANMFRRYSVVVEGGCPALSIEVLIRALGPVLAERRPRPRWKTALVSAQNLRWIRTSVFGRLAAAPDGVAPAGIWRPVTVTPADRPQLLSRRLVAQLADDRPQDAVGRISVEVGLSQGGSEQGARFTVLDASGTAVCSRPAELIERADAPVSLAAAVDVPNAELWWPHTHGSPALYEVVLELPEGTTFSLGRVGFRHARLDRDEGRFRFTVNGVPIFLRGICWVPLDPVSLQNDPDELRRALSLIRDAGLNMIRVTGTAVVEDDLLYDACDAAGILLWQDCMLATLDPPDADSFTDEIVAEVLDLADRLRHRPSLVVLCGGSETEQQPAMLGLAPQDCPLPLLTETIAKLADREFPGVGYVSSTPSGGNQPFDVATGVAHYFGVGAYERDLSDARTSGIRFAAESLAFAIPPERATVDRVFGGAAAAGHAPRWKRGVARDAGASWDFEDTRDHYVRRLFAVDPTEVRRSDPERYLDLGRAALAEIFATTMARWRAPASGCSGALVLSGRDVSPGAGWGITDAEGSPKAPWYALRRVLAPVAVVLTDDGLDGLTVQLFNDGDRRVDGELAIACFDASGRAGETASVALSLAARAHQAVPATAVLGQWRDLNHAYRFGPPSVDAVRARLSIDGVTAGEAMCFVSAPALRPRADIGLAAHLAPTPTGWTLTVSTRLAAQFVALDVQGLEPEDNWFHLAPGARRDIALRRTDPAAPDGRVRVGVRALNADSEVTVLGQR